MPSSDNNAEDQNDRRHAGRKSSSRPRPDPKALRSKSIKVSAEELRRRINAAADDEASNVNGDTSTADTSANGPNENSNSTYDQHEWIRRLGLFGSGKVIKHVPWGCDPYASEDKLYSGPYDSDGEPWDMWAVAYRMLGGFIDCDWQQEGRRRRRRGRRVMAGERLSTVKHARNASDTDDGSVPRENEFRSDGRDLGQDDDGYGYGNQACGRWIMWAAVSIGRRLNKLH